MADVTFIPAKSFTGYPDGVTPVQFLKGRESVPVPEAFAQQVRGQGLVKDDTAKPSGASRKRGLKAPTAAEAQKLASAIKRRPGTAAKRRSKTSQD